MNQSLTYLPSFPEPVHLIHLNYIVITHDFTILHVQSFQKETLGNQHLSKNVTEIRLLTMEIGMIIWSILRRQTNRKYLFILMPSQNMRFLRL
jgi:hypothetical protein